MHVLKTSINSNPNIGLYALATNEYCLIAKEMPEHIAKEFEKVLKVPVHRLNIAGTPLIGVFLCANSKILLVPDIVFKDELTELDKLGINYKVIKTKLTALGNNILMDDEHAIINPNFSSNTVQELEKLGLKVKKMKIADEIETVGSCAVMNSKGCIIHRDATDQELDLIEKSFNIKCQLATVNMGNAFIRSGLIANDNGFIIGDLSSGPEIQNIDEGLGFIEY